MAKYQLKEVDKESDVTATLLSLPKRNLKSRIRLLEDEISIRRKISNNVQLNIGTSRLGLEDKIHRLRYVDNAFQSKNSLSQQIIILQEQLSRELIACFKDISELKEKIQEAREELAFEKTKQDFLSTG